MTQWNSSRNRYRSRPNWRQRDFDARTVVKIVAGFIASLLIFTTHGEITRKDIARVLTYAASECTTINTSSRRLRRAKKAAALRYHLRRKLRGRAWSIERKGNEILQELARKVLKPGKGYEFAIDYVSHEYYGKNTSRTRSILRGKPRKGTTHFVVHATLYTICRGKRVTIAVRRIYKGRTKYEVIRFFLDILHRESYKIRRLYIDRWFYSAAMVRYLRSRRISAIIAVPIKGKKGGIRGVCKGKRSRMVPYSAKGKQRNERIEETFPLAIICRYGKRRGKRRGVIYHAYAVIGEDLPLRLIEEKYRKRFGIETSYRIINKARAWTTSRSPELRTLYFFVAVILQNIWVSLKWSYFRERRQGVSESIKTLTFDDFLDLIEEGVKWLLGRTTHVPLQNWVRGGLLS